MLICAKCGAENQLGRVFCAGCGAKLDLDNVSRQSINQMTKVSWFSVHWKKLLVIPVILIVLPVILVMWPSTAPIGQKGTAGGGKRIENNLKMLGNLRSGQSYTMKDIKEQDINGYIEYSKREFDTSFVRVQLLSGLVVVKMVKPMFKVAVASYSIEPKLSYEVYYSAAGGKLVPRKATMGHLPLGFLKGIAAGSLESCAASSSDLAVLKNASAITLEQGKVSITFTK